MIRTLWWVPPSLAILCLARAAAADDTEDIQSLLSENVITTASTTAESASSAPATSVTISAEELRTYGLRTLGEAIDFLSIGLVTQDPLRTPDMGTRGVLLPNDDGKHYLLLINGHAVNDPLYGAARFDVGAGFPIDLVDHIEVIVGPGSVLYGSSAMLGVINVVTRRAGQYAGAHALGDFEPGRSVRVGAGGGGAFHLFGKDAELTGAAEYYERFGPDLSFDRQQMAYVPGYNGFERYVRNGPLDGVWGGTVKNAYFVKAPSGLVRFRVGDFDVSVMSSLYRRGIPYTTNSVDVDFDDAKSYEMDRSLRLDVRHDAVVSELVQITSRVYADYFDYQRLVARDALFGCSVGPFRTCATYDGGLARWAGIEERVSLNWLEDTSLVTLLGVDARVRGVRAKQEALDFDTLNLATARPFAPTAGIIDTGGVIVSPYLQQTWAPARAVDLNGGVRLDADSRFSAVFSPRAALALRPFEKNTVKVIYSQAFRAPTWMETDAGNYHQARSGKIRPETVRSFEASMEQRLGTQRLLVGGFVTHWDNLIEFTPLRPSEIAALEQQGELPIQAFGISRYGNVSTLNNFGWNAEWDGTLVGGKLSYGFGLTEAFARRAAGSETRPLVASPARFGNAHVSYDFGGYIPVPGLAVRYVGERLVDRYYIDPRYQVMPGAPAFVELRLTATGRIPGVRGLSYQGSVAYSTASHGPYVAGPGILNSVPSTTTFPLAPVDQLRFFVGLRYDLGSGEDSQGEDS